ncbi:hypothetical protein N7499_003288 [Penicillium canescens]|nr:hypothetical protein N7499_003288 [Penicillium canescens]
MGMAVDGHKGGKSVVLTGRNDAADIENAILDLQKQFDPIFILGIFYAKDTGIYNCVKQVCDVRCGIRNVNVLAEKLRGFNDQYNANVGLKINLKLGGANQSLGTADLGIISEGKTMLVGIDVTHPSPGSASTAPSVAGIVASIDSTLAQWPAEIRVQGARQEMVADLETLLISRLQHWAKCNKKALPENIIIYRDGVSEGQYNKVIEEELPLLQAACKKTYPATLTAKGPHAFQSSSSANATTPASTQQPTKTPTAKIQSREQSSTAASPKRATGTSTYKPMPHCRELPVQRTISPSGMRSSTRVTQRSRGDKVRRTFCKS